MTVEAWLEAVPAHHAAAMTRPEFLKAIRALSVRYVERRGALQRGSALDSAGKRAAFAGFYAPLHFLTLRHVMGALGGAPDVDTVIDAGCGTGVAGAAWALGGAAHRIRDVTADAASASGHAGGAPCDAVGALSHADGPLVGTARPPLVGVDRSAWALDVARATWRDLALRGRPVQGDFVTELERHAAGPRPSSHRMGVVLGWSLNELAPPARLRALAALSALADRGTPILAVEPVARQLVPWWDDWAASSAAAGARTDTWRVTDPLPPALATLDRDAGFDRDALTARSVAFNWTSRPHHR